jgi:hypothetical protein
VADLSGIDGGSGGQWHTVGLPTMEIGPSEGHTHLPWLVPSFVRLAFINLCLPDPECASQLTARTVEYDFTGDGQADRVWVDGQGVWWMEGAQAPLWDPQPEFPWSVTPAAGDYDGDSTWEPAIVTQDGAWTTPDNSVSFPFPEANVTDGVPTPADYDGDGSTDRAWFSTATATWYIEGHDPIVFGEPATEIIDPLWAPIPTSFDVPVPADYDGDGSADLAVYNPWSNRWRVKDVDGLEDIVLGKPGDQPVAVDYDGDGRAEIAVLEQHTGVWTAHGLGHIATIFAGEEIDLAVAVDFSGNGQVQPSHLDFDRRWHAPDLPVLAFDQAVVPALVPAGVLVNHIRLWFIKRSWLWPGCDEIDIICDGPE